MKSFSELGIKITTKGFEGDKIKIERILNKEIIVEDYRIENSKIKEGDKCLWMQIVVDGNKRVLFSGSKYLQEMIKQVKKDNFPFKTTIIKNNDRLEFT